jgi:hypothetical protein
MQNELIKFRVAADDKLVINEAAGRAGLTVSELLRRAARAAASGRIASRAVLTDLVTIRTAANRLAALAETPNLDPRAMATAVKIAADDLRAITARHLATVK